MQLIKNKGIYDVCMELYECIDLQILKYKIMEIFMYKRIKVYECAGQCKNKDDTRIKLFVAMIIFLV